MTDTIGNVMGKSKDMHKMTSASFYDLFYQCLEGQKS